MMRSAAVRALIRVLALIALVGGSLAAFESTAVARECPDPSTPIETDRPDITNSSIVVPVGSLQNENGIDLQRKDAAQALSGTNSRWRLGIAPCLEVLVDLPNYFTTLRGGVSGFSDVAPAVKWQLNSPQSKFDLSITAGAALPSGASAVSGPGVQPYLQIPWSLDLGGGWAITGMETNFFSPASTVKFTYQTTFVIEKEIAERAFLFAEYVGTFPASGRNNQLFNSGAGYRIDKNQQIDFHIGVGLDRDAPSYVFGLGYSFRFDGVFRRGG
ncbi:MAG TPA: transporter [Xanthobacteraceae bacterium]